MSTTIDETLIQTPTLHKNKRRKRPEEEDHHGYWPEPEPAPEPAPAPMYTKADEDVQGTARTESREELMTSAMDIVEGVVLRSANRITDELKASYDKDVYADVLYAECNKGIGELCMDLIIERHVIVPIRGLGRIAGSLKVPFLFSTKSGKPLLLLEVKTKKTALKEADMETLGCVVEQIALSGEHGLRPRAMLLNFCAGVHSSMVMQCDGTISN